MAVEVAGRPLPVAVVIDERLERAQQLVTVLALGAVDRLADAVAIGAQGLVGLEREQQGERAEVGVGRDLRGAAVADRRGLERAASLVEGAAKRADRQHAARRDPDRPGAPGEVLARRARGL